MRIGFALTGLLLALIPAVAAGSEKLGDDIVNLKDGGFVRGTIVSVEPGKSVVVLEYGKDSPRTLPWSVVSDVQRGNDGGGVDESPADDVPLPDLDGSEPSKTHRTVYIETDAPADLYKVVASGSIAVPNGVVFFNQSKSVCASPCGESIDIEGSAYFFVGGQGFPASRQFRLDSGSEPITVNVETGSNGGLVGGITLTSLGGASILAGGTTLLLGGLFEDEVQMGVGAALAGVGVAGLVGGILLISGSLTDIELQEGAPAPSSQDADQASLEPFERDRLPAERPARAWLGEF